MDAAASQSQRNIRVVEKAYIPGTVYTQKVLWV